MSLFPPLFSPNRKRKADAETENQIFDGRGEVIRPWDRKSALSSFETAHDAIRKPRSISLVAGVLASTFNTLSGLFVMMTKLTTTRNDELAASTEVVQQSSSRIQELLSKKATLESEVSRLSQDMSEINIELDEMISTRQTRLVANERLLDELFTLEVIQHMFSIVREVPYRMATLHEVKNALELKFMNDILVLSVDQVTQVCQILKSLGFEKSPHFRELWQSPSFCERNGKTPVIKTGKDVPKLALQVRLADYIGVTVPQELLDKQSQSADRFADDVSPDNATSAAQAAGTIRPFDPAAMSKQDAEALRAKLDHYLATFPPAQP